MLLKLIPPCSEGDGKCDRCGGTGKEGAVFSVDCRACDGTGSWAEQHKKDR